MIASSAPLVTTQSPRTRALVAAGQRHAPSLKAVGLWREWGTAVLESAAVDAVLAHWPAGLDHHLSSVSLKAEDRGKMQAWVSPMKVQDPGNFQSSTDLAMRIWESQRAALSRFGVDLVDFPMPSLDNVGSGLMSQWRRLQDLPVPSSIATQVALWDAQAALPPPPALPLRPRM